jgi:transcriptional regulator with XRE-family HTH domain
MNSVSDAHGRDQRATGIDRHVGNRLRLARKLHNLSQEAVAEHLGVTFQQVQKYENGVNRISAGRLHQAAAVLDVPVSYFFPERGSAGTPMSMRESLPESVVDCLDTREGLDLITAFAQIADPKVRRQVLQLVRSIAGRPD